MAGAEWENVGAKIKISETRRDCAYPRTLRVLFPSELSWVFAVRLAGSLAVGPVPRCRAAGWPQRWTLAGERGAHLFPSLLFSPEGKGGAVE